MDYGSLRSFKAQPVLKLAGVCAKAQGLTWSWVVAFMDSVPG